MPATDRFHQLLPWGVRGLWVAVLLVGGEAVDGAVSDRSATAGSIVRWGGLTGWVAGVAGMAVLSVITLTAVRVIVPVAVPVALASWIGGADATWGAAFTALTLVTTALVLSAEVGQPFVQASAYGDEARHLLRPPPAYLLAAVLAWALSAAGAIGTVLLLAAERRALGGGAAVATAAIVTLAWPRWHRLSRRWLVVVPVGIVIHDHLVLAETVMLRRQEIAAIHLAPADSDAADLSGPAPGHALEVVTTESITVIFAGTPRKPGGTAIHMRAGLITPTRPGQALRSAAGRRLPVG